MIRETPKSEKQPEPEGEELSGSKSAGSESTEGKEFDYKAEIAKIDAHHNERIERFKKVVADAFDRPEEYGIHGDHGMGNFETTVIDTQREDVAQSLNPSKSEKTKDQTLALELDATRKEIEKEKADAIATLDARRDSARREAIGDI